MIRKNRIITSFLIALVLLISGFSFVNSKVSAQSSADSPTLKISTSDLIKAGYANVTYQPPQEDMYQPATYFWVDGAPDKTNLTNLLMVSQWTDGTPYTQELFNYGGSQSVTIQGGRGQEGQLNGDNRIALNFAKGNYYIVIIGPTAQKVEALANIIADKI